jgi:4-diphosphocytidyl-2-C-methyl-D-erythritol kinase
LEIDDSVTATSLSIDGPFAAGVPTDDSNLVWRALDALGMHAAVRLHKGIPSGAGLGGGSADAAAVLRAFGGDADPAATLGADVPFCLQGGAARVGGLGEVVEPIDHEPVFVVIATPPFAIATADVYRAWDELGGPHVGSNELLAAAEQVEPRLRAFGRSVAAASGRTPVLAGSGSSFVVALPTLELAKAAQKRIAAAVEGRTWVGSGPT